MNKIIIFSFAILLILGVFTIFNYPSNCTSGWYITGYYTPIETQFEGKDQEILVDDEPQIFKTDFINEVKTEGWGKDEKGKYLGWYENKFHYGDKPLDYQGDALIFKTVAADTSVLPLETLIAIPSLPEPWNSFTYSVKDVGPSIVGKHIDVYVGEEKNAKNKTELITSKRQTVCIVS